MMLHLTSENGSTIRVDPRNVVLIEDASRTGRSRAIVHTSLGARFHVTETPDQVEAEKTRLEATERGGRDYHTKG